MVLCLQFNGNIRQIIPISANQSEKSDYFHPSFLSGSVGLSIAQHSQWSGSFPADEKDFGYAEKYTIIPFKGVYLNYQGFDRFSLREMAGIHSWEETLFLANSFGFRSNIFDVKDQVVYTPESNMPSSVNTVIPLFLIFF
ncbi:MAG TPA: hypothetical protein VN249_06740 [Prolixibacteraceae bacterium]|nr:hypothetical protein [Prolixibacteraceae bacterium]